MKLPPPITLQEISDALKTGNGVCVNLADVQDPGDPQGRSYRQVNAEKKYGIPLGALVEVEDTGERLYVVFQGRDCDQTPAYWLSMKDHTEKLNEFMHKGDWFGGYPEESLSIIRLPDQLQRPTGRRPK